MTEHGFGWSLDEAGRHLFYVHGIAWSDIDDAMECDELAELHHDAHEVLS